MLYAISSVTCIPGNECIGESKNRICSSASSKTGRIFISFRGSHFLDNFSFRLFLGAIIEECKPTRESKWVFHVKCFIYTLNTLAAKHIAIHASYFPGERKKYVFLRRDEKETICVWESESTCFVSVCVELRQRTCSEWLLFVIRTFHQNW